MRLTRPEVVRRWQWWDWITYSFPFSFEFRILYAKKLLNSSPFALKETQQWMEVVCLNHALNDFRDLFYRIVNSSDGECNNNSFFFRTILRDLWLSSHLVWWMEDKRDRQRNISKTNMLRVRAPRKLSHILLQLTLTRIIFAMIYGLPAMNICRHELRMHRRRRGC